MYPSFDICFGARLLRRRSKNHAITPSPIAVAAHPIPIPARAPVDNPEDDAAVLMSDVDELVGDDDAREKVLCVMKLETALFDAYGDATGDALLVLVGSHQVGGAVLTLACLAS